MRTQENITGTKAKETRAMLSNLTTEELFAGRNFYRDNNAEVKAIVRYDYDINSEIPASIANMLVDCQTSLNAIKEEIESRDIEYAWLSLTRLCGTNIKAPVTKKTAKRVFIDYDGTVYSVDRAKFEAGKYQFRGSFCIEPWGEKAERRTKAEANWMD